MWLINTSTLQLEHKTSERGVEYAILSHRWIQGEEVTQQDLLSFHEKTTQQQIMLDPDAAFDRTFGSKKLSGFRKISNTCELARREKIEYAWVDTCCINKDSSAELSEAINSMYRWYEGARVCYVFMPDVPALSSTEPSQPSHFDEVRFKASAWFTRGWTLQELIASRSIRFFGDAFDATAPGTSRVFLGSLDNLVGLVSEITGIPQRLLLGKARPSDFSVAKRMSWAAGRETERIEDRAYSLLGLFDISMPMLYGEAGKAFIRLQEEIIRYTTDQSIFAWDPESPIDERAGHLLASSPADFLHCGDVDYLRDIEKPQKFSLDNRGLSGRFSCVRLGDGLCRAVLNCEKGGLPIALKLAGMAPEGHMTVTANPPARLTSKKNVFGTAVTMRFEDEQDLHLGVARYDRRKYGTGRTCTLDEVVDVHSRREETLVISKSMDHRSVFWGAPYMTLDADDDETRQLLTVTTLGFGKLKLETKTKLPATMLFRHDSTAQISLYVQPKKGLQCLGLVRLAVYKIRWSDQNQSLVFSGTIGDQQFRSKARVDYEQKCNGGFTLQCTLSAAGEVDDPTMRLHLRLTPSSNKMTSLMKGLATTVGNVASSKRTSSQMHGTAEHIGGKA